MTKEEIFKQFVLLLFRTCQEGDKIYPEKMAKDEDAAIAFLDFSNSFMNDMLFKEVHHDFYGDTSYDAKMLKDYYRNH